MICFESFSETEQTRDLKRRISKMSRTDSRVSDKSSDISEKSRNRKRRNTLKTQKSTVTMDEEAKVKQQMSVNKDKLIEEESAEAGTVSLHNILYFTEYICQHFCYQLVILPNVATVASRFINNWLSLIRANKIVHTLKHAISQSHLMKNYLYIGDPPRR